MRKVEVSMVKGDGVAVEVGADLVEETVATAAGVVGVEVVIEVDTGEDVEAVRENLMRRERIGPVEGDYRTYNWKLVNLHFFFSSTGRGGGFRGGRDRENGRGGPKGGHNGYRE